LALAVGIVVGISLGSSERQAATIRLLQQDVAAIRSEDSRLKEVNNDLQRHLARHEEAVQQELLPIAVRGRLSGKRVAVGLVGDGAEELRAPVTRALRLAGAVFLILHLPRGAPESDETSTSSTRSGGGRGQPNPSSAASAEETAGKVENSAGILARALL